MQFDGPNGEGNYSPLPGRIINRDDSIKRLPLLAAAALGLLSRTLSVPRTYTELGRGVEQVVFAGRQQINDAWLRTYHETGRLIHEHLLLNNDRADYGAKVFKRLAADTGIEKRTRYQCAQFYRYFPIVSARSQLTWAHYRVLCQVADQGQRDTLHAAAIKHQWTTDQMAEHVRPVNAALKLIADASGVNEGNPALQLLTPKRGTVGLYNIVARGDTLAIDVQGPHQGQSVLPRRRVSHRQRFPNARSFELRQLVRRPVQANLRVLPSSLCPPQSSLPSLCISSF